MTGAAKDGSIWARRVTTKVMWENWGNDKVSSKVVNIMNPSAHSTQEVF